MRSNLRSGLAIKLLLIIGLVLNLCYSVNADANNLAPEVVRPLASYQVEFDYKNYQAERQLAYEYYKQNYIFEEFDRLDKADIGIALYDLNNDGKQEVITYLQNKGYCGSSGCRFHILKQTSEFGAKKGIKYYSIASGQIYPDIKILNTRTSGYHDLLIEDKRGTYIWSWDGKGYKVTKEIKESPWGKEYWKDALGKKEVEQLKNQ